MIHLLKAQDYEQIELGHVTDAIAQDLHGAFGTHTLNAIVSIPGAISGGVIELFRVRVIETA